MLVERHPILFYFMVFVSIVVAMIVAIIPLPEKYHVLRPELLCLLVIYWVISVPMHLGVTFAFFVGITQDLVEHTVWGAHALSLAVVAYICINAYQRIISYSTWHQTLWVSVLIGVHQMIVNWVQSLNGYQSPLNTLLASVVISTLMWPVLLIMIRRVRQSMRMT